MDAGLVRGILWRHLATARPALARGAPEPDPVDLAPAGPYADALLRLGRAHGDLELRRLGRDYAALWGRSFPNLVRHLRGRPERALSLWAEEVYPFLRGDRLAARLEPTGRGAAHLTLADDLPSTYLAGMVEGFLGLAGAESSCEAGAAGRFDVRWNLRAELWLASSVRRAAALRIPLLACAFLSALVGASAGAGLAEGSALLAGSLVVVGAVAAQSGANAIQDLRNPERESPLDAGRLPRSWSWFQCLGSYAVAAACGGALLGMGRPWIVPLAAVGLALGVLYAFLRDQGWGPAIAGLTYGPLMVTGSAYAVAGPAAFAHPFVWQAALPASIAVGSLSAAYLLVDDLADRPLDEAAGHRTLVVRMPGHGPTALFAALFAGGVAGLILLGALAPHPGPVTWGALGALPAALLVRRLHVHADDPNALAPVRAGTLGMLAAASAVLLLFFGGLL